MIYLLGGGKSFNNEIGSDFKSSLCDVRSIVFVPTTPSNKEKCEKYKNVNLQLFSELGINFEDIDMIGIEDTEDKACGKVRNKDIIFLMGGDPISQLELIRSKRLDEVMKGYKGIIIGISAGALSICERCIITRDEDYPENMVLEGLNLTKGINVEVHYDSSHDQNVLEAMGTGSIERVYGVPENCAIKIKNDTLEFLGSEDFYVFEAGEKKLAAKDNLNFGEGGEGMSRNLQKALELFGNGFNCSQSVIGAFCEQLGVDEKLAMKLACGFGGGLRCGEVCGAVSGAAMIIGLKYGQYSAEDKESKEKCYKITSEFMEEYSKRKGTVLCREILGYDVRDSKARAMFPGRQKEVCPKAIEAAVLLLEEMGF